MLLYLCALSGWGLTAMAGHAIGHALRVRFKVQGGRLSIGAHLELLDGVLPNDEVHVWRADLRVQRTRLTSLLGLLDADEQQRAARFKIPAPREQFVISHAFLRLTLSRYLQTEPANVSYRLTANGKPELVGGGSIRFNLSHTDGAAALAVTRNRAVGIDIERVRENVESLDLADHFFSRAEASWLRSQPESERLSAFFAVWTAKEALLKAHGTGFSTSLADFTVIPNPGDARVEVEMHNDQLSRDWSIWQLNVGPELRAAVAVEGMDTTVRCGSWVWT